MRKKPNRVEVMLNAVFFVLVSDAIRQLVYLVDGSVDQFRVGSVDQFRRGKRYSG